MYQDWITTLLPVLNATGIPLLAVGLILLIRAYQKSGETYRETSNYIKEENKRLQEANERLREQFEGLNSRLIEANTVYFEEAEKMREFVSKANQAVAQLQARKVALLSSQEDESRDEILADVKKINEVLELLDGLTIADKELNRRFQEHTLTLERNLVELTKYMGRLAEQIGDTKSRLAVLKVVTTTEAYEEVKSETTGHKRGMIAPPTDEQPHKNAAKLSQNLTKDLLGLPSSLTVDIESDDISCENCGTINASNASYCLRCGEPLN